MATAFFLKADRRSRFSLFFILLVYWLCLIISMEAAYEPADLTVRDVRALTSEMMAMHPAFKELNSELVRRLLRSFANELDPLRLFCTAEELSGFLSPTKKELHEITYNLKRNRFSHFEQLFKSMPEKIVRTEALFKKAEAVAAQSPDDFVELEADICSDADWPEDEGALFDRIISISAARNKSIARLAHEDQQKRAHFLLKKERMAFEQYITPDASGILFEKTFFTFFMRAFARSLDSQSAFFAPGDAKYIAAGFRSKLCGIGVILQEEIEGFSITDFIEGGPALDSGLLRVGDLIIAVDGDSVIGIASTGAADKIQGAPGTSVQLTLMREVLAGEKQIIEVSLDRKEIVMSKNRVESVTEPCGDGIMASIRFKTFYQDKEGSTHEDVLSRLFSLQETSNLRGLILDLRDNHGGLLDQAVRVSGLFLHRGIMASIKDYKNSIYHLRNEALRPFWSGPLVILVDRHSASASEIVAQTLQDWGRALVVGDDRTFGKGSFQICTLSFDSDPPCGPQGAFKVSQGLYYTVSGISPQLSGVKPDIEVPGPYRYQRIGEKFLLYPLSKGSIKANFQDRFDDLPFYQRFFAGSFYDASRQERLSDLEPLKRPLAGRSFARIQENSAYQACLESWRAVGDEPCDDEGLEKSVRPAPRGVDRQTDFQLQEAWNILRDLIDAVSVEGGARLTLSAAAGFKDKKAA